jgi:carbon monoxide dehydrogenase subunit G
VWDVLYSPATSGAVLPGIEHALSIPGTGPGLGEIQVEVRRDAAGQLHLRGLLITAWQPPTYVRYASLDGTAPALTNELALEPTGASTTRVRWTATADYRAGTRVALIDATEHAFREFTAAYLRGAGSLLNARVTLDPR